MALGKAALILVPIGFLAVYLVPRLLRQIARSKNNELFLLVLLAICLGTAALTEAVGLSLALGAFAAGLIVSASDYAHRALDQLLPLRDAFVALFFVTVGILINPRAVLSNPLFLLAILLMVIVGKFVVWTGVVKAVRLSAEDRSPGGNRPHPDRRVLLHSGTGRPRQRPRRRPVLLCDVGSFADLHPAQCHAGPHSYPSGSSAPAAADNRSDTPAFSPLKYPPAVTTIDINSGTVSLPHSFLTPCEPYALCCNRGAICCGFHRMGTICGVLHLDPSPFRT